MHFDDGSQFIINDSGHTFDKVLDTSRPAPSVSVENRTLLTQFLVAIKNGKILLKEFPLQNLTTIDSTIILFSSGLDDVDYVQKIFANEHQFTRTELDYVMRHAVFEGNAMSLYSIKHQSSFFYLSWHYFLQYKAHSGMAGFSFALP